MQANGQPTQNNDRETQMRFMRIGRETGEALREFWPHVEKICPEFWKISINS